MGSADELVDVVDDDGRTLRRASRAEVRAGNLRHRSVFVAVVTGGDELVVHRRADWKDVWPSRWDVCFGGVLGAGEAWGTGAVRELAEEAGVVVGGDDLELLGEGRYDDERVREIGRVFLVRSDGPFTFPDGEVAEADQVGLADLDAWLAAHDVVDDSCELVVPLLRAWWASASHRPSVGGA